MAATLDLGNLLVHLRMNVTQYMAAMNTVEAKMKVVSTKMISMGRAMSMRVTLPLVAMGYASVRAFSKFDDAMTKSLAIMQDITPQLRQEMENLAVTISTRGVTSATDLAKSYFFLASAGLDAQQSMASLAAVERFAVAGAFDMALATDLATDAQSALGLTVKDAQQNLVNMTRVTDVLTGANTLANASTRQFSEALTSQAGPAMKAYGIELEEGVAVLAAYADQGIKAQRAGNMFSRMLRLMTKGFQDNREAWRYFGISIYDATGELKPFYTIIRDLSRVLTVMSTEQRTASLAMLGFQARSQQAILPLLGLQDRIRDYNKELLEMGGITERVYKKQLKSFSSQMKILWNQIKSVGRDIGHILAPSILHLNEKIKNLIRSWKELNESTRLWIVRIGLIVAAIGPLMLILGKLWKLLVIINTVVITLSNSFLALTASMITSIKVYGLIASAIWPLYLLLLKVKAVLIAITAHPLVLLITAVVLLGLSIRRAVKQYKKVLEDMPKIQDAISKTTSQLHKQKLAWEELSDIIRETKEGELMIRQMSLAQGQVWMLKRELEGLEKAYNELGTIGRLRYGKSIVESMEGINVAIEKWSSYMDTLEMQGRDLAKTFKEMEITGIQLLAEEQLEEAQQIFEATRTPMERYERQIEKLNKLVKAGAITWDTYGRAVQQAEDRLKEIVDEDAQKFEERQRALKSFAEQIFEATRTPMERYERQIESLGELLKIGAIEWDTYGRAVRQARDTLEESNDALQDLKRFAEQVFEETRTPIERYEQYIKRLQEALRVNLMDVDTFKRAMGQASEKFFGAEPEFGRERERGGVRLIDPWVDVRGLSMGTVNMGLQKQDTQIELARTTNELLADIKREAKTEEVE